VEGRVILKKVRNQGGTRKRGKPGGGEQASAAKEKTQKSVAKKKQWKTGETVENKEEKSVEGGPPNTEVELVQEKKKRRNPRPEEHR